MHKKIDLISYLLSASLNTLHFTWPKSIGQALIHYVVQSLTNLLCNLMIRDILRATNSRKKNFPDSLSWQVLDVTVFYVSFEVFPQKKVYFEVFPQKKRFISKCSHKKGLFRSEEPYLSFKKIMISIYLFLGKRKEK